MAFQLGDAFVRADDPLMHGIERLRGIVYRIGAAQHHRGERPHFIAHAAHLGEDALLLTGEKIQVDAPSRKPAAHPRSRSEIIFGPQPFSSRN
jgi:hypothetical protein